MDVVIRPGFLKGEVAIPPSKSFTQRAYAASLLHLGKTIIRNHGNSNDEKTALKIIKDLGVEIAYHNDSLIINSKGVKPKTAIINCKESGLAARIFTTIVAIQSLPITINGEGSLLQRPMHFFRDVLPQLSVMVQDNNGRLPITVSGAMIPKNITMDGSESSQFLSGLLMAYAFTAVKPLTIEVENLKSKPYIDLTIAILKKFGKIIEHHDYKKFIIYPSEPTISLVKIDTEADWSSAAYWIVGGIINGDVCLKNLNEDSLQSDKTILKIIKKAGGDYHFNDGNLFIKKQPSLNAFNFDATDAPDLFPILSILAANCKGRSSIRGVHRLIHKESNRAESISAMLKNFGVVHFFENDRLHIEGKAVLQSCTIDSFNDHRIVMAAAMGSLNALGNVRIKNAEAVAKSYPKFFEDLGN